MNQSAKLDFSNVQYSITPLRMPLQLLEGDSRCKIRISNTGPAPLRVGQQDGLKIGWRLRCGPEVVHEGRASVVFSLSAGESKVVSCELGRPAIRNGDYTIQFALVIEGVAWIGLERQDLAVWHEIKFAPSLEEARELIANSLVTIPLAKRPAAQVLYECASNFDFRDRLESIRNSSPIAIASIEELPRSHQFAEPHPGSKELNRLFHYAYCRTSENGRPGPSSALPAEHYVTCVDYLTSLNSHVAPVLPTDAKELFSRDVTVGRLGHSEITGLELHFLMEGVLECIPGDRLTLAYQLIERVVVARNFPLSYIPDSVLSYLGETILGTSFLQLSRYLTEKFAQSDLLSEENFGGTDHGLLAATAELLLDRHAVSNFDQLFGSDVIRFWTEPILPGGPSAIALLAWAHDPKRCLVEHDNLFEYLGIQFWFDQNYTPQSRLLQRLSELTWTHTGGRIPAKLPAKTGKPRRKSVCLAGIGRSETGIGANFRMLDRHLQAAGCAVHSVDTSTRPVSTLTNQSFQASIVAMNAEHIPEILLKYPEVSVASEKLIGFFLWEYSRLSMHQHLGADLVDRIWAPSQFVADCFNNRAPGKAVLLPKVIDLSHVAIKPRSRAAFTFFTSFDTHSGTERKNPLAALRAFQEAFPPDRAEDVRFVVKLTEWVRQHWGDPERQQLQIREMAQTDPRIELVIGRLPLADYLSLIANADCVVSCHRSEGFGYLMAHAMSFGVPVVATGYSGNCDFCTEETSFPVHYELVPVRDIDLFLPVDGAEWADVDVSSAAMQMRKVYKDREFALRIADVGQAKIKELYSQARFEKRLYEELEELGVF